MSMHFSFLPRLLGGLAICLGGLAVLLSSATRASAQSSTFDFEDGTDDGFGLKFSNDASASFPIVNIGGSNRMLIARTGAFQEADSSTGNTSTAFFQAMAAAAANPAGYNIGYDYYIDTSAFGAGAGGFLQIGSYVNTGSGFYAQDFGAVKEAELNGTQLASGQVFQGHVSVNMAAAGFIMPAGETFYRLGLILNGDGASQAVYFDNVSVSPVPEPASLALMGLGGLGLGLVAIRRRSK